MACKKKTNYKPHYDESKIFDCSGPCTWSGSSAPLHLSPDQSLLFGFWPSCFSNPHYPGWQIWPWSGSYAAYFPYRWPCPSGPILDALCLRPRLWLQAYTTESSTGVTVTRFDSSPLQNMLFKHSPLSHRNLTCHGRKSRGVNNRINGGWYLGGISHLLLCQWVQQLL